MFDIYTIVFLAVAVFIFLRLRSVLGQRTGRERPPYDPFSRDPVRGAAKDAAKDNVVSLPGRAAEPVVNAEPASADRWKGYRGNRLADRHRPGCNRRIGSRIRSQAFHRRRARGL